MIASELFVYNIKMQSVTLRYNFNKFLFEADVWQTTKLLIFSEFMRLLRVTFSEKSVLHEIILLFLPKML